MSQDPATSESSLVEKRNLSSSTGMQLEWYILTNEKGLFEFFQEFVQGLIMVKARLCANNSPVQRLAQELVRKPLYVIREGRNSIKLNTLCSYIH